MVEILVSVSLVLCVCGVALWPLIRRYLDARFEQRWMETQSKFLGGVKQELDVRKEISEQRERRENTPLEETMREDREQFKELMARKRGAELHRIGRILDAVLSDGNPQGDENN